MNAAKLVGGLHNHSPPARKQRQARPGAAAADGNGERTPSRAARQPARSARAAAAGAGLHTRPLARPPAAAAAVRGSRSDGAWLEALLQEVEDGFSVPPAVATADRRRRTNRRENGDGDEGVGSGRGGA